MSNQVRPVMMTAKADMEREELATRRDSYFQKLAETCDAAHELVESWINGTISDKDALAKSYTFEFPSELILGTTDPRLQAVLSGDHFAFAKKLIETGINRVSTLRYLLEHMEHSHFCSDTAAELVHLRSKLLQSQFDLLAHDKKSLAREFRDSIGVTNFPPRVTEGVTPTQPPLPELKFDRR